jgi:hypothetical protein
MLEKKHILLLGVFAIGVLIFINSNKKIEMVEVEEQVPSEKKSFDSTSLPLTLMPPTRLGEGESLPNNNLKKNFSSIFNLKPRLDKKANNFL